VSLLLLFGGSGAPPYAPQIATEQTVSFRRKGWRKSRALPEHNTYPSATPPEDQKVSEPFVTRNLRNRRTQRQPDLIVADAAPPPPAVPLAALVQHKTNRRHARRPDIEIVSVITSIPLQPVAAWGQPHPRPQRLTHRRELSGMLLRDPTTAALFPYIPPDVVTDVRDIVIRPFMVEHWRKMQ
jgi:hypothetical protein